MNRFDWQLNRINRLVGEALLSLEGPLLSKEPRPLASDQRSAVKEKLSKLSENGGSGFKQQLHAQGLRQDVAAAADSGQGITKPEVAKIFADAYGQSEQMNSTTHRVLSNVLSADKFARKSTAELAQQVLSGQVSAAVMGQLFGRSQAS